MIVLAVDTATTGCSVAVWRDGATLAHESLAMTRGHAEALLPAVARALAVAGIGARDVELFAVTVGPGAFTGLRVGLAAARGLALAAARPCVGVTTLEAVAAAVPAAERAGRTVVVALETRRDDLFVQLFAADGAPLTEPAVMAAADVGGTLPAGPVVVAGDGASPVARALAAQALAGLADVAVASSGAAPDARIVAAIAAARRTAGQDAGRPPDPLYLRPPAVTRPLAGGRRRP